MRLADALRTDPKFKAMYDDAARVNDTCPPFRTVAHRDQATGQVSFRLTVRPDYLPLLQSMLPGVPVVEDEPKPGLFQLHGSSPDMDRLLHGLGITR